MDESQRLVNDGQLAGTTANHGSIGNSRSSRGETVSLDGSLPKLQAVKVAGNGASAHAEVPPTLDDKASLAIVMCVVFLGDTARGIFFPTLWTYVKAMGGDSITLGYCVGAFSVGRVLSSPYFGNLSTKYGYKKVLITASCLIALGAVAYAGAWSNNALIAAQILMGVGSGTLGVTRAYVADKSTPEQRTYLLAYTTAVQYAGFTCMPFLGGFLSFLLGSRSISIIGDVLVLDQFTAPAFVMAVAASTLLAILEFRFVDSIPKPKKKGKPSSPSAALVASDASAAKYLMGTPSALSVSSMGRNSSVSLSGRGSEGEDEDWPPAVFSKTAANAPIGLFVDSDDEDEHRKTPSNSDVEQGLILSSSGYNSSNGYSTIPEETGVEDAAILEKNETGKADHLEEGSDRNASSGWCNCHLPSVPEMLIYGGFLLNMSTKGTIACFETLGAEYAMTHFSMTNAEAGSTFATFGSIGVVSLLSMRLLCRYFNDVQIVLCGMAVMIAACLILVTSPSGATGLPFFLGAVFLMYSIGYPIGHTAVLGLFSKVVGAQPQGTLLGWFGSAGSLARIVFPVIAGVISQELGTSKLFVVLVGVLCITFGVLFTFRKPYLECVEITKNKKKASMGAVHSVGARDR